MQASSASPFSASASPFQMGGNPLFKTAGNETVAAPPINSPTGLSPFSVAGTTPTNAPLTVGDVIQQLPPEVVRVGALPMEQPLSLPPALVENALRSGQAALPVFELYRVCPAMFQMPISPQDPRMVSLPATKLPGLIAQAREGQPAPHLPAMPPGSSAGAAAASPFSLGQPVPTPHSPAGSPFQMQPQASPFSVPSQGFTPGAAKPESTNGNPFSPSLPAAEAGGGSPFSMSSSKGSPFEASSSPPPALGAPAGSPFSLGSVKGSPFEASSSPPPAPGAPADSPFSLGGFFTGAQAGASSESPGSPFSLGGAGGSPFGASPAPQPAAGAPAGSPFSFGSGAGGSPFGAASAPQPAAAPAGSPFAFGSTGGSPFAGSASAPPAVSLFGGATPAAQPPPATEAPVPEKPEMGQVSISQLFTPQSQAQASTPADAAGLSAMPFGSPFVSAMKEAPPSEPAAAPVIPAGLSAFSTISPQPSAQTPLQFSPAPASATSAFAPLKLQPAATPAVSAFGAPATTPAGSTASAPGVVKLGFAAVLGGHSMEELGFNPSTLPTWISTNVPAHVLKEQMATGSFVVELGLLVDGLTDIGFRNTLSSARRDCRIKLPQNEVFHALTQAASGAPIPTPQVGATPAGVLPAARPATMQVLPAQPQPGAPGAQSLFGQPAVEFKPQPAAEPVPGAVLNPFAQSQQAPAPVSAFGAAPPPAAAPSPFSFPAAPAQALASLPQSGFGFSPPPAPAEPPASSQPAASASFFGSASPQQPQAGAFQHFGASPTGTLKPFDPFASSSAGPLPASKASQPTDSGSGLSSAQLLGQTPAPQTGGSLFTPVPEAKPAATSSLFAPAPEIKPVVGNIVSSLFAPSAVPAGRPSTTSLFSTSAPALLQPTPAMAPALEEIPSFSTAPVTEAKAATRRLFGSGAGSIPLFSDPPPVPRSGSLAQAPVSAPAQPAATKTSYLGLAPLDTQTDQLLLRALLATEEKLDAQRVVEMLASMPGLSACVCLSGTRVLSHADLASLEAAQFLQQAPEIARQLRGLVPLIGIEGAETFTLNAGGRLLTFCFPGESILGVLHDEEPSTGMRDKITLIARELARMLS